MENKNFAVKNIFVLPNGNSILAVKNFNLVDNFKNYNFSLLINGEFYTNITMVGKLNLKGQSNHLDESPLEIKEDLSSIKNLDLNSFQVTLNCDKIFS